VRKTGGEEEQCNAGWSSHGMSDFDEIERTISRRCDHTRGGRLAIAHHLFRAKTPARMIMSTPIAIATYGMSI
jgi:hypothetical protein